MDVEFRELTMNDYDQVRSLWDQSEGVGLRESDEPDGVALFIDRNPGSSFVAVADGQIVGTVMCGHDGRRGYLYHLAVAKSFQRRNIGSQLVELSLRQLATAGIDRCNIFVYADNDDGKVFWKRSGWFERDDLCVMQHLIDVDRTGK